MDLHTRSLQEPAWRIHPNPTALPNLPVDGETPSNRFDDPKREYRVRYFATNKRGAFLEVLARFRRDDETQSRLGAVKGVDEKNEPKINPGAVPKNFLSKLQEVTGQTANSSPRFVDATAAKSQASLGSHSGVRHALKAGGLRQLDDTTIKLGGFRGRPLTQIISRIVFDETEAAGIYYISRLDATEPLWAIFDWVSMRFSKTTPIHIQDAALRSAALSLGLVLP